MTLNVKLKDLDEKVCDEIKSFYGRLTDHFGEPTSGPVISALGDQPALMSAEHQIQWWWKTKYVELEVCICPTSNNTFTCTIVVKDVKKNVVVFIHVGRSIPADLILSAASHSFMSVEKHEHQEKLRQDECNARATQFGILAHNVHMLFNAFDEVKSRLPEMIWGTESFVTSDVGAGLGRVWVGQNVQLQLDMFVKKDGVGVRRNTVTYRIRISENSGLSPYFLMTDLTSIPMDAVKLACTQFNNRNK